MDDDLKRLVVLLQLEAVLVEILNEENDEYAFYKSEDPSATPADFLREVIEIGCSQEGIADKISKIANYYQCDVELAVLLYVFTDALNFINLEM